MHIGLEQNLDVRLSLQLHPSKVRRGAKLLFTDTDSLAYNIQTEDFYKDIAEDIQTRFDTSDCPIDHASHIKTGINKKTNMKPEENKSKNL